MLKFLLPFSLLIAFSAHGQINSKSFSKKATSSISRISLFTKKGEVDANILWSQYDATKRSSLIAVIPDENGDLKIRVLAENTPDAALESISKIVNSINYQNINAESALEFSRSIAQIKRSSAVENFRSISYRIAEMINNDGTLNPDVKELIQKLIEGAVTTSQYDNEISIQENKTLKIRYEASLLAQENKALVLNLLKEELEKEQIEERKQEIIKEMTKIVQ